VYWCDVIASGMYMSAVGIIGNRGRNRPIADRNEEDVMTSQDLLVQSVSAAAFLKLVASYILFCEVLGYFSYLHSSLNFLQW